MERRFNICGLAPYPGKGANAFLAACDLGIEGVFAKRSEILTATIIEGTTQSQLDAQPAVIKQAYEQAGWREVTVVEEQPQSTLF